MQFTALRIRRAHSYEPNPEHFRGEIEVESPKGKITLNLNDNACRKMLDLVSAGIAETAAETATFLRNEATALTLEHKDDKASVS